MYIGFLEAGLSVLLHRYCYTGIVHVSLFGATSLNEHPQKFLSSRKF